MRVGLCGVVVAAGVGSRGQRAGGSNGKGGESSSSGEQQRAVATARPPFALTIGRHHCPLHFS
jgi:hypothetical protein